MHAVVRTYRHLRDFDGIAHLIEKGLVPLMREVSGFRGYYAIRCGERTGISVTLFDSEASMSAGLERGTAWVQSHLAELYRDGSPETMIGEVIVAAEP